MRAALAQLNPTIGAIGANCARIVEMIERARQAGADLVVFPELSVCGYPPKDLLLQEGFVEACERAARSLGEGHTRSITIVIGCPTPSGAGPSGTIGNALLAFRDGAQIARYDKRLLPTYDVFDEDRYFEPGHEPAVIEAAGVRVGLSICEDLWRGEDVGFAARYLDEPDPVAELIAGGAEVIVNPSASPFVLGKGRRHRELLVRHARAHGVWIASVNQVGGNDELIFDGHACAYDPQGLLVGAGPGFEEAVTIVDIEPERGPARETGELSDPRIEASAEELLFRALTLGVRDYCRKTGFEDVIVALSGGIDSSVTAAVAASALGRERVLGIAMPSRYSTEHSTSDAHDLSERLGIRCVTIPIASGVESVAAALSPAFEELGVRALGRSLPDVAEENVQSRLRGLIVMAVSNRTGALVLTTGNKSELAVGYCTLYGDMNGGLAVLSDVTKNQVYDIARWMNAERARAGFEREPIPARVIDKPPSAELAPEQRDSDTLPSYDVLDEIVRRYIERHESPERIRREMGLDAAEVSRVVRMIDVNEYKRKQLATGLKVSGVAFGFGRRFPVARGWAAGSNG